MFNYISSNSRHCVEQSKLISVCAGVCVCICYFYFLVPTPPGSIIISHRTNSSLRLEWTTPLKMDDAPNIKYIITYTKADNDTASPLEILENSTNLSLNNLESGTFYNIAINTIGPQHLKSVVVHNSSFTRKFVWLAHKFAVTINPFMHEL